MFAIEKTSSNPDGDILTSNHADNVKYSYSGGSFKGASTVIKQITFQRLMFYKAIYPYTSSARNEFTFSVKTNQSYGDYYTLSEGNGNNSFKVILPPQTIAEKVTLITLKVGSKTFTFFPENDFIWKSGMQYTYDVTVSKAGIISFTSSINPWETDN